MKEICVVHLVRAQNGIESFSRFLESYREFPSGVEHDFLVVFKGFNHSEDTAKYKTPLAPLAHLSMDVSDEGFDITAYFSVVNRYSEQYRYFCFVNSHSEILDKDWLKKLYTHISIQGVGMVGATGSWESHRESTMPLWKLPIAVVLEHYRQRPTAWGLKWLISELPAVWRQSHYLMGFDPFPNFHIRTNAFMISSDLIKSFKCPPMNTKEDAYKFESGSKGLSRSVLKMGKKLIVVGKNGMGYEKENWCESKTFRQSEQENLLVADNQTRDYQFGTPERRRFLTSVTWGQHPAKLRNE